MESTGWSEVIPMQRIVIFLFGLLLGGGLMASVPPGKRTTTSPAL